MIASVAGTVQKNARDHLIVQVGGIGLRVYAPRNVLEDAGGIGRAIRLHTHFLVRENEMTLYGFNSEEDLQLFELLLGVSGVGPKVGLAILSTLSPELLKSAVMREECHRRAHQPRFQHRGSPDSITAGAARGL